MREREIWILTVKIRSIQSHHAIETSSRGRDKIIWVWKVEYDINSKLRLKVTFSAFLGFLSATVSLSFGKKSFGEKRKKLSAKKDKPSALFII